MGSAPGVMSMDAAHLEEWLTRRVASELGVSPDRIDVDLPLAQLGLDSATAVLLTGELEDLLGTRLSPTLVFEHPTIRRLAAQLAR